MFLYEDFTVTVKEWFFCILAEFCLISPCTNYLVYYAARFSACVQKRAHSGDLTRYLQTLDGVVLNLKVPTEYWHYSTRRKTSILFHPAAFFLLHNKDRVRTP